MFEPTMSFKPFGEEGPQIALFGAKTGDWSIDRFQQEGDHLRSPGLYFRFNRLAEENHFLIIAMPTLTDCNTKICNFGDLDVSIQNGAGSVILKRGVRADGVVLSPVSGLAGAITSADCPTIVACCPTMRTVIIAHGGCKSLIGNSQSVVDEVINKAIAHGLREIKVFITCGISGQSYTRPDLARFVSDKFGAACAVGEYGIDLKKIAARQFEKYGVNEVMTDFIDTYLDMDECGEYLWHSYRRSGTIALATPVERAKRNLVLVINQ